MIHKAFFFFFFFLQYPEAYTCEIALPLSYSSHYDYYRKGSKLSILGLHLVETHLVGVLTILADFLYNATC